MYKIILYCLFLFSFSSFGVDNCREKTKHITLKKLKDKVQIKLNYKNNSFDVAQFPLEDEPILLADYGLNNLQATYFFKTKINLVRIYIQVIKNSKLDVKQTVIKIPKGFDLQNFSLVSDLLAEERYCKSIFDTEQNIDIDLYGSDNKNLYKLNRNSIEKIKSFSPNSLKNFRNIIVYRLSIFKQSSTPYEEIHKMNRSLEELKKVELKQVSKEDPHVYTAIRTGFYESKDKLFYGHIELPFDKNTFNVYDINDKDAAILRNLLKTHNISFDKYKAIHSYPFGKYTFFDDDGL